MLLFALSLRGSGQIAAQFTSIWTASISVEQRAILSIPSRNLGEGSGESKPIERQRVLCALLYAVLEIFIGFHKHTSVKKLAGVL